MEPTIQPTPTPQSISQPQTFVSPQPAPGSAPVSHHVSFAALLGFSLAVVFGAASVYFYLVNQEYSATIDQSSAQFSQLQTQLQAQLQQPKDTKVSLTGPVTNGVFKVNDSIFVFLDSNGKAWIVDSANAQFVAYSYSTAKAKGTDGKLTTTLPDWLKTQNMIGTKSVSGAPGTTTLSGVLKNDGIVYADSIQVSGQ